MEAARKPEALAGFDVLSQGDPDLEYYYWMKLVRAFEERVSRLHRQNKILGGVYSGAGQEAIVAGICAPLKPDDVVFPLHRDLGVFLLRGADPGRLMAQLMGKERGFSRGKDSFLHAGDVEHGVYGSTSMLGSSLPVAVGAALKFQLKREPRIAVAFFGEGTSSRGDVHEAMNFAGVRKLPVLFVCENNRYAYSTPIEKQMAIENVADRAQAYGFRGHVCPGNDLLAVLQLSRAVVSRIRAGEGPALIECKTYRYHGHSEHDPALYRSKEELVAWESRDPIQTYEFYLQKKGYDLAAAREQIDQKVHAIVQQAVDFAEQSPYPAPEEALTDLYATPIVRNPLGGTPVTVVRREEQEGGGNVRKGD
jgi:pyruvate dehydrogenase E1 component alpha subunit